MSPLSKYLAVISATIIASAQASHHSPVFPQDICVKRSRVDSLHSLPIASFPHSSEFHLTIVTELDRMIEDTYERLRMREAGILQRRRILSDLVRGISGRNLKLDAFGSCCNGFGMITSDLDVQVTGDVTRAEIIQLLDDQFSVHHISERKPLILLQHSPTGIMVDMMLNPLDRNHIGLSIWLLRKYSRFDSRVQVLGVFLKTLVKTLKISETRYGDPGSSPYMTMLMHYLQQMNPPVLPVITKNENNAEFVVRNNATVGQLWLGFLRVLNQLQTVYLKDNYNGLLHRNDVNLDYHPRYGHKTHLLVDTWGYQNRTACGVMGPEWIRSLL